LNDILQRIAGFRFFSPPILVGINEHSDIIPLEVFDKAMEKAAWEVLPLKKTLTNFDFGLTLVKNRMQSELIRSVKGLIDTMHRELKNFVERGRKMSVKKFDVEALSKQNVFKSVQLAFDRFITNLEDYAIGKNSTTSGGMFSLQFPNLDKKPDLAEVFFDTTLPPNNWTLFEDLQASRLSFRGVELTDDENEMSCNFKKIFEDFSSK
jgi:hypothetical protein